MGYRKVRIFKTERIYYIDTGTGEIYIKHRIRKMCKYLLNLKWREYLMNIELSE